MKNRTLTAYQVAVILSLFFSIALDTVGQAPTGMRMSMNLMSAPSLTAYAAASYFQLTSSISSGCRNRRFERSANCLTITTSALPSGEVGKPYSETLTANGGTTPYAWKIAAGTLPAGLKLNSSTGLISGTPTAAANAISLIFEVTDSGSSPQIAGVRLKLTISAASTAPVTSTAAPLTISTTSLASGQIAAPYSQALIASGGTTPYVWKLTSGTLPDGLALNPSTGVVSGTPTAVANATALAFSVTDSSSPTKTANVSLTLTISPASLAITTSSLPSGQVGTAYSQTLAASGGTRPYTWTLSSGTLPNGLALNSSSGVISGTPNSAVASTPLGFKVTDASSPANTANVSLTLTINAATLAITTSSLAGGQVGTPYSALLAASGGTTPYTWKLTSGTLPGGLTFNISTGLLSGTPTGAANATPLAFSVTDSSSPAKTANVSLTLTIASASLAITTLSLPGGQVGTPYSASLIASGGTTPYTWKLTSGTLPSGLTFNTSTALLSGTPTAAASATPLTFGVTDSSSPAKTASINLTLTISPATLVITTSSLAAGQVGTAYSQALAATGGTTPYTWTLTSGTLPGGLTLNSTTGSINGTPTTEASATPLTFKVTDSNSPAQTASVSLALTIAPTKLTITTLSLPSGQVGTPYSQTLAATGGTTPYTWKLASGTLPGGLTLNPSTGSISGTPTTAANVTPLTFTVTDSGSPAQTASVSVTLSMTTLTITTLSLPGGQAGMAYSQALAVSGGTAPYTWVLTSGTLPAGLTLNTSTGLISGTPTAPTTGTSLTFKVTDSTTPTAQTNTASFTITITGYSTLLSWSASSSSATVGYNVYRSSVSGSGYVKLNSAPVLGLTYIDTTVVGGQTYYYVTTAVDSSGDESTYSNQVQAVVP